MMSGLTEESEHTALKTASTNGVLVACSRLYLSASLITGHFNRISMAFFPRFFPLLVQFSSFSIHPSLRGKTKLGRERKKRASVQSIGLQNVKFLIQVADQISHASDTSPRARIFTKGSESEKMRLGSVRLCSSVLSGLTDPTVDRLLKGRIFVFLNEQWLSDGSGTVNGISVEISRCTLVTF